MPKHCTLCVVDTEPRTLTAGEYRLRLIGVCEQHLRGAERIERAEGRRPVFGLTVQLEIATTETLATLRPPPGLAADHRRVVALWGRRVSLLGHYYDRYRREIDEPAFQREFARALREVDRLSRALQQRFEALGVPPECDLFV